MRSYSFLFILSCTLFIPVPCPKVMVIKVQHYIKQPHTGKREKEVR